MLSKFKLYISALHSFILLNNILLYGYTTFYQWIHGHLDFMAIMNKAAMNIHLLHMFSFLLGIYLGVELLNYMVTMLNRWRNCHTLPKLLYLFTFPLAVYEVSDFSTSTPTLVIFHYSHLGEKWYLIVLWICISLMT